MCIRDSGGLYAEMVQNRSFEKSDEKEGHLYNWGLYSIYKEPNSCLLYTSKIKPPNDLSFLNDYLNCICISNIFLKHYKQDYTPQ